jgi:hypothetical protein
VAVVFFMLVLVCVCVCVHTADTHRHCVKSETDKISFSSGVA